MTVLGIRESKGLEFKRACVYGFFGSYVPRSSDSQTQKKKNGWKTVLLDAGKGKHGGATQLPWQMVGCLVFVGATRLPLAAGLPALASPANVSPPPVTPSHPFLPFFSSFFFGQEYELKLLYTAVTRCRSLLFFAEPSTDKNARAMSAAKRWLTADHDDMGILGKLATVEELETLHESSRAARSMDALELAGDLATAAQAVVTNSGFDGLDENGRNPKELFDDARQLFERAGTTRGDELAARVTAMLQVYTDRNAIDKRLESAFRQASPTPGATVRVVGPRGDPHVGRYAKVTAEATWDDGRVKVIFPGGNLQVDPAHLQACVVNPVLEEEVAVLARHAWNVGMLGTVEELVQQAAFFDDSAETWSKVLAPLEMWTKRTGQRRKFLENLLQMLHANTNGIKIDPYTSPIAPGLELKRSF
jgi:hypothetical protein